MQNSKIQDTRPPCKLISKLMDQYIPIEPTRALKAVDLF